jgi:hypothetical protein
MPQEFTNKSQSHRLGSYRVPRGRKTASSPSTSSSSTGRSRRRGGGPGVRLIPGNDRAPFGAGAEGLCPCPGPAGRSDPRDPPVRVQDLAYFDEDEGGGGVESGPVLFEVGPNAADLPLTQLVEIE